ncbi:hypothetical protein M3J09_002656 [Ascochyta lentis]
MVSTILVAQFQMSLVRFLKDQPLL